METRDTVKTGLYFKSYIEEKERNNAELTQTAATTNDKTHYIRLLFAIYQNELECWIARYSADEAITVLKDSFERVIDALDDYLQQPGSERINLHVLADYIQALWLISIAFLINAEDRLFKRIIALIDQSGKDGVLDQLIKLRIAQHQTVNTLVHPGPYMALYNALLEKGEEKNKSILSFIDNYYTSIQDVYWMDIDPEKGNYFGRWLFELAAFVKSGMIDDQAFVNNPHYPKDLVYNT
jgi:hypothetical protein